MPLIRSLSCPVATGRLARAGNEDLLFTPWWYGLSSSITALTIAPPLSTSFEFDTESDGSRDNLSDGENGGTTLRGLGTTDNKPRTTDNAQDGQLSNVPADVLWDRIRDQ